MIFLNNLKLFCYLELGFSVLIYSWKLIEKFMKTKTLPLSGFLSNFKLFCYLDFPFLYIYEKLTKTPVFNWLFWIILSDCIEVIVLDLSECFWVILAYFVTWISHSYIFMKMFSKICDKKNVVFKWSLWTILSHFVTWTFLPYIFLKVLWNIYENKNGVFKWLFFNNLKLFCNLDFASLFIGKIFLEKIENKKCFI